MNLKFIVHSVQNAIVPFLLAALTASAITASYREVASQIILKDEKSAESGDAIYFDGSAVNIHGHGGIWVGVTGDDPTNHLGGYLYVYDDGQTDDPRVQIYCSALHQYGYELVSKGIDFNTKSKTVKWSDAFLVHSGGSIVELYKNVYNNVTNNAFSDAYPSYYRGNRCPSPLTSFSGYVRDRILWDAETIENQKANIGYTPTNMFHPICEGFNSGCLPPHLTWDGVNCWDGNLFDIAAIRCDAIAELIYENYGIYNGTEFRVANFTSIMTASSHDATQKHNNLHNNSYNSPELCPWLQGGVDVGPAHTGLSWGSITEMNSVSYHGHSLWGAPYLYSIDMTHDAAANRIDFNLDIDDYGSNYVYMTLAGFVPGSGLEVVVNRAVQPPFSNYDSDINFFRPINLSYEWTPYYPPAKGPAAVPHNYDISTIQFYGRSIGKNHVEYIRSVTSYSSFQLGLMDRAGNYTVYVIYNPFY